MRDPNLPLVLAAFERALLVGPDSLARAAATTRSDPQERWMLRLPRDLRVSFARTVVDPGGERVRQEHWLLQADEATRLSYVRHVLDAQLAALDAPRPPVTRQPRRRRRVLKRG